MSFWRTFGFHTISSVDTLLDKEDFTLEELLDEEEILQEVKSQNRKLLEYLSEPATLRQLVEYITKEPAEEADSKRKFKYPFLACEILCAEVWVICEAIYNDEALLKELYGFLKNEPPLNPSLTTYVCRTAGVLLQRKVTETIEFMKKEGMVDHFIKHLSNASVMDLLLKVISCEESADGAGILEWLCQTDLIRCLMSKFEPANGAEVHENAAQALVDIISVSGAATGSEFGDEPAAANASSSPLLEQMESEDLVETLFTHILNEPSSSVLLNGLTVLIELVCRHVRVTHDATSSVEQLPSLLRVTCKHLPALLELLDDEKHAPAVRAFSTRTDIAIFGFHKLKVVEFVGAAVRTNYACIERRLLELRFFDVAFSLFTKYRWNNFLHTALEQLLLGVFKSDDSALQMALVRGEHELLTHVVRASDTNDEAVKEARANRLGYMGHLVSIGAAIQTRSAESDEVRAALAAHEGWQRFAADTLDKARMVDAKPLGGHRPTLGGPGDSSDDELMGGDDDAIFDHYQLGLKGDDDDDDELDVDGELDGVQQLSIDVEDDFDVFGREAAAAAAGGAAAEGSDTAAAAAAAAAADGGSDGAAADDAAAPAETASGSGGDGNAAKASDAAAVADHDEDDDDDAAPPQSALEASTTLRIEKPSQ